MQKIKKEVKTYKEIYVSIDGKEFNNEADCRAWENSYEGTLTASWALIKKVEANSISLGLPWSNDDYECYVIKPKNLEEITLINAYIDASTHNNGVTLTTAHINELVALNFGYDHDYCEVYSLDEHIKKICEYRDKMNSEFNETEEASE